MIAVFSPGVLRMCPVTSDFAIQIKQLTCFAIIEAYW